MSLDIPHERLSFEYYSSGLQVMYSSDHRFRPYEVCIITPGMTNEEYLRHLNDFFQARPHFLNN